MKRKKIFVWLGAFALLPVILSSFAYISVRKMVASEGYDTDEAAWNYIFRDGEVRIRLKETSTIKSYEADTECFTSGHEVGFKAGYGVFSSKLVYETHTGEERTIEFRTDKFNNWNRVLYIENLDGTFDRFDNGVKEDFEYQGP